MQSKEIKIDKTYIKYLFYLAVIFFLRIDLVFSDNMPTGGDMGAHVAAVDYFVKNFFPNLKLMGWSNMWFAGIPLYYFYFPFPPLIVSILSIFLPFGIAFKLMVVGSVLGVIYAFDKLFRDRNEIFSLPGFVCGVLFVLTESFTIYGGNLASTLAGQYSFTYSVAFGILAYNSLVKDVNRKKFISSATLFALCILSHLIPFIFFSLITFYKLIFIKSELINKVKFITVFSGLSVFWLIPMITKLGYTTDMAYTPFTRTSDLIKDDIIPLIVLSLVFLILFFKEMLNEKEIFQIGFYMATINALLFFVIPPGALWNGRLVPLFNLGIVILFGVVLKIIFRKMDSLGLYLERILTILSFSFFPLGYSFFISWGKKYELTTYVLSGILLLLFIFLFITKDTQSLMGLVLFTGVLASTSFLPNWINWNFTGYEGKQNWSDISSLYDDLNNLPPGRITWEANPDLNEYGTPMVLMTLPMYTNHSSMEGLYFDSSITTPFHFISVSGLSEKPSNPVGGLRYFNGDFERGINYLKELGVDYYITNSEKLFEEAIQSKDLIYINKVNRFGIFEVKESYKIVLLQREVESVFLENTTRMVLSSLFRGRESRFYEYSINNFYNLQSDKHFVEVPPSEKDIFSNLNTNITKTIGQEGISNVVISDNKISFETEFPGKPHIVKVSYFPNWKLNSGYGPYRVDPSFMLIIPSTNNVELEFKRDTIEVASLFLSIILISTTIFLNRKNIRMVKND